MPPRTMAELVLERLAPAPAAGEPTISSSLAPNLVLVVVVAVLVAAGVFLLLDRSLVRVLLGTLLIGNGVSVLFLVSGGASGKPPFYGTPATEMSDPLPQAMVLTAIVISLATIGFLLALSYRLWQVSGTDNVPDDIEDEQLQELADLDEPSATFDVGEESTTTSDELAEERS
ncbi:Na(+)/H(+) antiporter subunit C [Intrasporangium chromatireducens]|uniref:Na(+)/H(+) antiporter subunit C n=1 Tax=Intrasporangium chromatireducens TaxID=1386088 RepID=UPI0004B965E3|nr:Na(+)/H(+) antiporter subunit C [Intrasporangium chromatireducens]